MAIIRTLQDEAAVRPRTPTVTGATSGTGTTPAGGSETPSQPAPGFQAPPPIKTTPPTTYGHVALSSSVDGAIFATGVPASAPFFGSRTSINCHGVSVVAPISSWASM